MPAATAPLTAVRRLAIFAQGYASRGRRATTAEVETAVRRLSCVQLDSISTVERSHRMTLGTRIGDYPREAVSQLLGRGRLFEYWAHEACLLPAEDWPLFRPGMENGGRRWYGEVDRTHPHLREHVLEEIRARGALGSRHFEGAARQGEMWGWKPAKRMLELLWNHGDLVVAGRQGFQRLYDLPERVLAKEILEAPTPAEDERFRTLRAASRGGARRPHGARRRSSTGDSAAPRPTRRATAIASLVDDGLARARSRSRTAARRCSSRPARRSIRPQPSAAVLLSPFDNLLWDRPFARRALGFDHLIEVYKPAPQRRYGYYVLPLLWRDRIVGRADLKSERARGELVVRAFHVEPGVRASSSLDDAFDRALDRLRRVVGLDRVVRE